MHSARKWSYRKSQLVCRSKLQKLKYSNYPLTRGVIARQKRRGTAVETLAAGMERPPASNKLGKECLLFRCSLSLGGTYGECEQERGPSFSPKENKRLASHMCLLRTRMLCLLVYTTRYASHTQRSLFSSPQFYFIVHF